VGDAVAFDHFFEDLGTLARGPNDRLRRLAFQARLRFDSALAISLDPVDERKALLLCSVLPLDAGHDQWRENGLIEDEEHE
jgi:hypothetical protein